MPDDLPSDIFAADLDAITERNSVTFTWTVKNGGAATSGLTGVLSAVVRAQRDVNAGFLAEFDAVLVVAVSQFSSGQPKRGDTFTIGSVSYQVMEFTTEPSGVSISYKLNATTK